MWNPPPPDLRLNLASNYSSSRRERDVARSIHSNNSNNDFTSPKNSFQQDRGYNTYDLGNTDSNDYNNNSFQQQLASGGPHPIAAMNRPNIPTLPHPRLEKVAPYLTIASLQAYTILTVVRCLADPVWIVHRNTGDRNAPTHGTEIGQLEKSFLACAIAFTMVSCLGVTLRILDKFSWLKKIPVMTAYLEAGGQFSHGFLACVITVIFSTIVAAMLTIDWYRGFPSAGLSATLKALIISSFVMTIVIIIGAAIYSTLENWTFDDAVNFCIVSFATIGYGDLSPKTSAGRIIFFFYGLLGISSLGFFVVSLRNAVIEQFQWRLVDRFSKPAHLTRVQTRMSAKDISFPAARFEEEQQVKKMVKRRMIMRMVFIWIVMWFGGAGVFCAFEPWTYLESLYFCFVTLTTIGFGDYVPEEPGSIEFWNVYVFVGLSVFAYILSLSSESMASQIHLVDDQDEDDDADMYGWERNEDPNAPLTTRSGILGLEGLKWLQQQQQQPQAIPIDEGNPLRDQESKLGTIRSHPETGADYLSRSGNQEDQHSTESSIQRYRAKRKNSSGKILMVSAKERKQMLQAEYYANHSLPTTIRFVDTHGVPHQKVIRRGMSGSVLGSANASINSMDSPALVYSTVGYHGTIGRGDDLRRAGSLLRTQQSTRGVGVANGGTMYGSGSRNLLNELNQQGVVQTEQLKHQPLIKFDSPKGSVRSAGGERNVNSPRLNDDRLQPGRDYIPSCLDMFDRTPTTRGRSNSWDFGSGTLMAGPSQNEIHRWIAEDAGTLEGPSFAYAKARAAAERAIDESFWNDKPRHSQNSDITKVPSPLVSTSRPADAPSSSHLEPGTVSENRGLLRSPASSVRSYSSEGIAPDEIVFTEEPEELDTIDAETLHQSPQADAVTSPSPPTFIAQIREPTLQSLANTAEPSSSNTTQPFNTAPPNNPHGQFLHGVANSSNDTDANNVPVHTLQNSELESDHSEFARRPIAPASLLNDDLDHQITIYNSDSRPMSLFSNHLRSGYNSAVVTPAGSRGSSRAPSVLMTIFDEPIPSRSKPASRDVSRSGSIIGRAQSTADSAAQQSQQHLPLGQAPAQAAVQTLEQSQIQGQAHESSHMGLGITGSSLASVVASPAEDVSIGPFDEVRIPKAAQPFDDDVDLNHVELSPELFQAEYDRRKDMRRREREIEERLANSRPHRQHHSHQHGHKDQDHKKSTDANS
ncbi:Potassium channel [Podila epigama]|nr:Potassium channel [Podila epigama]